MAIIYRVYSNRGAGGPVDYSGPIATTAGLRLTLDSMAAPSDTTFVVRALDTATNLEESNTTASVRLLLDPNGQDVSAAPNAPHALVTRPTKGDGCRVSWAYCPLGQGGPPLGFDVYLTPGARVDYSSPVAAVPYTSGRMGYRCDLTALTANVAYAVAVRARNSLNTSKSIEGSIVHYPNQSMQLDNLSARLT